MQPVLRIIILWFSGVFSACIPFIIYSAITPYTVWESLQVLNIFSVATAASMLSFLLPAAYLGGNNCRWGEHPEFAVFMFTSFITLPLVAVIPPNEEAMQNIFMSRDVPIYSFFALWMAHGAVNAIYVKAIKPHTGIIE